MAIVQISQLQIRRGLNQDLPQLASAELGWSLDTRQLYIGNGTLAEGAPSTGITEILTEYSDILKYNTTYTFKGTESGYLSQTGPSLLHPVTRSLQDKLDDNISAADFGLVGDGQTDNTAAMQRLFNQVYPASESGVDNVRRTIKFSAGNYLVSGSLQVPPGVTLVGDGQSNTIITGSVSPVFYSVDSLYQTGFTMGYNGGILPGNWTFKDLTIATTSLGSALQLDSVVNATFRTVGFTSNSYSGNLISTTNSVATPASITFDDCQFTNGNVAIAFNGPAQSVISINSTFSNQTAAWGGITGVSYGIVSENNFYSNVANPLSTFSGNNYSIGDTFATGDYAGIHSGNYRIGTGRTVSLQVGTNLLYTLANGAGVINYQINDNSNNYRSGMLRYTNTGAAVSFEDDYNEPATSLGANLYISNTGVLSCVSTSAYTFKYNLTKFI